MARIPLVGGAYKARSVIAEAQRCVNLYGETNPQDAPVPVTYYPTPGHYRKMTLAEGTRVGPGRGAYRASNGELFVVVGSKLYFIDQNWVKHTLGDVGWAATPVGMGDNGLTLVVVNGKTVNGAPGGGWLVDLTSHAFSDYTQAAFYGSDTVDYVDTFLLFNRPGTKDFYSSLSNTTDLDALYIAAKTSSPDLLESLIVCRREILLLGQQTSEVWNNVGAPAFPFAIIQGASQMYGTTAKYSRASNGASVFFVQRDKNGKGMILRYANYKMLRISDHSIETAIAKYPTLDDAIGFCYQIEGHSFYVVTFPSGDATWVFDEATEFWHQWAWRDPNNALRRTRSVCHAFAYGKHVTLDWENGNLYWLDFDADVQQDIGRPIYRARGFPHIITGFDSQGQAIQGSGKRISFRKFEADLAGGVEVQREDNPVIWLRWSDTKGVTWGNPVPMSLGAIGEFFTTPTWWNLGAARDRVYELFWDAPLHALNGAYIDPEVLKS